MLPSQHFAENENRQLDKTGKDDEYLLHQLLR